MRRNAHVFLYIMGKITYLFGEANTGKTAYLKDKKDAAFRNGIGCFYTMPYEDFFVSFKEYKNEPLILCQNPEAFQTFRNCGRIGKFLYELAAADDKIHIIIESATETIINKLRVNIIENRLKPVDIIFKYFKGVYNIEEAIIDRHGQYDPNIRDLWRTEQIEEGLKLLFI